MENEREAVWRGMTCRHIDIEISVGHPKRDTPQSVRCMSLVLRRDIGAGDRVLKSRNWIQGSG